MNNTICLGEWDSLEQVFSDFGLRGAAATKKCPKDYDVLLALKETSSSYIQGLVILQRGMELFCIDPIQDTYWEDEWSGWNLGVFEGQWDPYPIAADKLREIWLDCPKVDPELQKGLESILNR